MLLKKLTIQVWAWCHGLNSVRDISHICFNERQVSIGSFCTGSCCRTNYCMRSPTFPNQSLWWSIAGCSISRSNLLFDRTNVHKCLNTLELGSWNFCWNHSIFAAASFQPIAPWDTSFHLQFVYVLPNLAKVVWIMSHRLHLPVTSSFVVSAILKARNKSCHYRNLTNLEKKKAHTKVRAITSLNDRYWTPKLVWEQCLCLEIWVYKNDLYKQQVPPRVTGARDKNIYNRSTNEISITSSQRTNIYNRCMKDKHIQQVCWLNKRKWCREHLTNQMYLE